MHAAGGVIALPMLACKVIGPAIPAWLQDGCGRNRLTATCCISVEMRVVELP